MKIKKLASLAGLLLTEDECERLESERAGLTALLDELPPLGPLPISDKSPFSLRQDEIGSSFPREAMLKNACKQQEGYFVVPRLPQEHED